MNLQHAKILLKNSKVFTACVLPFSWHFALFLMWKLNKNMCLLFGANLCPFRCFLGVSYAMLVPISCHVSPILNARFVWYFAILSSWILGANYAIFYYFTFDFWLLLCDIFICLLKLIFDYYFAMFPFVCWNWFLITILW